MSTCKQAILTGSIADGFGISQIVDDTESAESIVNAHLANGKLAEAIEIQKPSVLNKRKTDHENGVNFIVFGSGLDGGTTMFGPFPDEGVAGDFGERYRSEDEEWNLFTFEPPVLVTTGRVL